MANRPDQSSSSLLELRHISKSFPGVKANDDVSLTLDEGEIHALLGENGAGKSTLVKMIYGILKADSGQMFWRGKEIEIRTPAQARSLGVAMVFQHFSLFDSMSVLENIALGLSAGESRANLQQRIIEVSNRYGLPLDPQRHVFTLSVGERQRIEIIRCLLQDPKLLVMDEPTSVLTPQEVEKLFQTLNRLSEEGVAILYISHKLDEIKTLCRRATILRGGKVVDSVQVERETPQSLAAKMMGEELQTMADQTERKTGEVRLTVKQFDYPAKDQFGIALKNINLQVCAGEILGIAGVAGNGQDELLSVLNGEARSTIADAIMIDGQACAHLGPNERRAKGLASIPEERLGHGAVPQLSLSDNSFLTAFQRLKMLKAGFISHNKALQFCNQIISDFNVQANGARAQAGSLSGGNLQKFIVGREISQHPGLLIVSQPTWGVDAGAAQTIHKALRLLAENGSAILVISQDLDELMTISDRIGAICAGVLSEFIPARDVSVEQIGLMMAGVNSRSSTSAL